MAQVTQIARAQLNNDIIPNSIGGITAVKLNGVFTKTLDALDSVNKLAKTTPSLQSVLAAGNSTNLPIITSDRIQAGANGISSLGNLVTNNDLIVNRNINLIGGINVGGNYVSTGNLQAADVYLSEDLSANIVTSRQLINNDVSQFVHANYNGDLENLPIPATSIVGLQPFIQKQVYSNLHAAQLATAGVTHVWQCSDAVGSATIADSKGSVAMQIGTSILGNAGLLDNNQTGVQVLMTGAGVSVPPGTLAVNGAFTLEFITSVFATVGTQVICNIGSTDAHRFSFYLSNSTDLMITDAGNEYNTNHKSTTGANYFAIVCNGVDNVTVYQNGISIFSGGVPSTDGSVLFGRFIVPNILQLAMRIQDIATYNVALTPAQINAHLIAAKK